jgi:sugar phosphate isomerase/epimerase
MVPPDRRQFLRSAATTGTGLAMGASLNSAPAIEPIRRTGKSLIRLSLAAYSFRRYLELKNGQKGTMSLDDFVDAAAAMPLDAVELTAYYFAQTTNRYLCDLKGHCTRLGLDVSGCATRNDFCNPNAETVKKSIADVKRWIEHTSRLGGKTLRIFTGPLAAGDKEERARARCIEAIQEVCDHGAEFGVYLALENHGGITDTIDQTLTLVRAVKHNWFGVNFDTGNFHSKDPYADLVRLAPYAVVCQIKTEIRRMGGQKENADLKRLIQILRDANFRGYVALEHEANEDPKEAVPRHLTTLRKLISG